MAAPASWRLVGRTVELERIAQARSEGRAGIVVYGPPGLGKSRLAREALAHARDEGARIGWVQATRSAASVPLGAFASLIPPEVRSDDPFELMQRSVEALRGGGRGSLLIALDDAQWLDPTSAALALHLASSATAFVVATVRSGETCPDAIVSLWKDAGAPRFELGLLSARETGDLVAEIVGGPLERSARRWAYETSGGNALYVRELVAGALDSDALKLVGGLWRLVGRPPVSASLTDLIASRMQDLGEDEQRAVELLALGEPLRLAELESLTSSRSLAALQEHGLVSVAGVTADAEVRLAHPLYGETLRSRMVSLRVRDLLLALVQTVQGRAELEPEDTVRLARWLSDAGEPIATGLLIRAARAANHAGDPGFGASFAQRALDAGAGVEASLLLARALTVQSQFEQAEAVLVAAEGTVQSQTDAFEYLQQQSEVLHWGLGRPAELGELLDRAAGWWPDPTWHERLEPLRLLLSQFEEFRGGLLRPAQILTDADLDPELRSRLEPIQVANLFYSGQARAAHELAERIRPALPVRTVTDAIALSLWCRIALEDGEHWSELDEWTCATLDAAVRLSDHATAGQAAYSLACLRTMAGRYVDAGLLLAESEAQLERHDPLGLLCVINARQVIVAAARGERAAMSSALERCIERLNGSEPLPHQMPYVVRARAWATHAGGEHRLAQQQLLDAARLLAPSPIHAAGLTYEAMRAGAETRRLVQPLAELRERCDARLVAAYAEHAAGRAVGDGSALMATADEMTGVGALRYATEAAADAARAFLLAGREDSARRAAARSRELFVEHQGGTRPVIEGLDRSAIDLTARETELVALASEGLTNTQIAERLVLSVRTVESHLYRAMQKLGVSDRRDL